MRIRVGLCVGLVASLSIVVSLSAHAQPAGEAAPNIGDNAGIEIPRPVDRTVINEFTPDPIQLMISRLTAENRVVEGRIVPIVVELCNVELDLTGQASIVVGDHRSLIASPDCARGPSRPGPLIKIRLNPTGKSLFEIRGDQVTFSGFRLEGPNPGIWGGDENTHEGILINPFESDELIRRIEISNMEIFHWSGAAISVKDSPTLTSKRGRLFNTNESAVTIRNNFVHHNRHDAGWGYGVVVGYGAYALIERNVFEENRHAIAGDSSDEKFDYSGYTLRDNLILPGGGLHCLANWGFLNCRYTHQIDMHGDKSWWRLGQWCCGIAGETMIIQRNTILYTGGSDWNWGWHGYAIKIRGNPVDKVVVDANVFRHANQHAAISQNGGLMVTCAPLIGWPCFTVGDLITRPIDVRSNDFDANPLADLGNCDFDGDGLLDQFMATGVTWWAKSKATGQWRYLNTMPEMLSQLQLVDLDRDNICDVAERSNRPEIPPRRYSKGGTEQWAPWIGGADPTPNGVVVIPYTESPAK